MFGRRKTLEALKAELAEVEGLISAHPLASERTRAAHEVVEADRSRSPDEVDRALADDGLPSLRELGRAQVAGSWTWWSLHRRRRELRQQIDRAGRR